MLTLEKQQLYKILKTVQVNAQSSIYIGYKKKIYFDPYKIENPIHNADIVFITHGHPDHFSIIDIKKVCNDKTIVIMPKIMYEYTEQLDLGGNNLILCDVGEEISLPEIYIKTVPAYNLNKKYHLKENNWLGYIVTLGKIKIYVSYMFLAIQID